MSKWVENTHNEEWYTGSEKKHWKEPVIGIGLLLGNFGKMVWKWWSTLDWVVRKQQQFHD